MKKEDFIVGKWYTSSRWDFIKAAKFSDFRYGQFHYSERITNVHKVETDYTVSDNGQWETFRELTTNEIKEHLPKGHPDLNNNIPEYVKWIDNIGTMGVGKQTNDFVSGKIFNTRTELPIHGSCCNSWEEHLAGNIYQKNYIPSTKKEYDEQNLRQFPTEGYAIATPKLIDYLANVLKYDFITTNKPSNYIKWLNGKFLYLNTRSIAVSEYTIGELNKYININTKKENYGKSTKVYGFTYENTRPSITGTATIRCRGQQVTIGVRPNSNKACVNTRRTNVIRVERREKIGLRENS